MANRVQIIEAFEAAGMTMTAEKFTYFFKKHVREPLIGEGILERRQHDYEEHTSLVDYSPRETALMLRRMLDIVGERGGGVGTNLRHSKINEVAIHAAIDRLIGRQLYVSIIYGDLE